jgi:Skp family chaperone for outer membrane proteins
VQKKFKTLVFPLTLALTLCFALPSIASDSKQDLQDAAQVKLQKLVPNANGDKKLLLKLAKEIEKHDKKQRKEVEKLLKKLEKDSRKLEEDIAKLQGRLNDNGPKIAEAKIINEKDLYEEKVDDVMIDYIKHHDIPAPTTAGSLQ